MITPSVKLHNGYELPAYGLGTFLNSLNNSEENGQVEKAVKYAIDIGYRHFDTAFVYRTEPEVGKAIRDKIAEGVVQRNEIFVVTKLWCTFHEPQRVEYACRKSLENLGLDYIDLYLMHAPIGFVYQNDEDVFPKDKDQKMLSNDIDYLDTWKAMERLVKLGLTRSIGISNFNSEQIDRLLSVAEIHPVNNQIECHPNLNQKKLIQFCKERNIIVTAYCPLGRPNSEKKTPNFFYDSKINEIGKKYNKTSAQIILRYLYQIGTVPLPKSVTNSRIKENIEIFDFELSDEDMKIIDGFQNGERIVGLDVMKDHKYYPFGIEL